MSEASEEDPNLFIPIPGLLETINWSCPGFVDGERLWFSGVAHSRRRLVTEREWSVWGIGR